MTTKTRRYSVSVTAETYEQLQTWCAEHGVPVQTTVERVLKTALDKHEHWQRLGLDSEGRREQ